METSALSYQVDCMVRESLEVRQLTSQHVLRESKSPNVKLQRRENKKEAKFNRGLGGNIPETLITCAIIRRIFESDREISRLGMSSTRRHGGVYPCAANASCTGLEGTRKFRKNATCNTISRGEASTAMIDSYNRQHNGPATMAKMRADNGHNDASRLCAHGLLSILGRNCSTHLFSSSSCSSGERSSSAMSTSSPS